MSPCDLMGNGLSMLCAPSGDEGADAVGRRAWLRRRPSLPPMLAVALGTWVGIGVLYPLLSDRDAACCRFLAIPAACLVVALLLAMLRQRRAALPLVFGIGLVLGMLAALVCAADVQGHRAALEGRSGDIVMELSQDGTLGDYGESVTGRIVEVDDGMPSDARGATVRVNLSEEAGLMAGERIGVHVFWSEPSEAAAESFWRKGIAARANASSFDTISGNGIGNAVRAYRRQAIDLIAASSQADSGSDGAPSNESISAGGEFLQAVLLGWRRSMFDSEWYAAAKVDGLAHLVAVSGAHLSIVCSLVLALLERMHVGRGGRLVAQGLVVCGYLVLTGVPVSALRAAFMVLISLSAFVFRRRAYSLGALSFCIVVLLVIDPVCAFSLSFTLSALSTLGIVLFARFIGDWIDGLAGDMRDRIADGRRGWHRRANLAHGADSESDGAAPSSVPSHRLGGGGGVRLGAFAEAAPDLPLAGILSDRAEGAREAVALALAASLLTNFLVAAEFGQISIVSPLANVLAAPFFALICGIGLPLVLVASAVPPFSAAVSALSVLGSLFCLVLQGLAALPGAAAPAFLEPALAAVLTAAVPLALWAAWPRPGWRLLAAGVLVGLVVVGGLAAGLRLAGDRTIMLDVGQGDAIVLCSGGKTLLIDTGNQDDKLLQGLARYGITHLDAVAISHADDDHCGSLSALQGVVGVDRVLVAADTLDCTEGNAVDLLQQAQRLVGVGGVVGLETGDSLAFGHFLITVVGPDAFIDEGGNADSLTLLLETDANGDGEAEWRGLFCGDAEAEQLADYQARGRIGDVDVYKVGHHGSRAAITSEVAESLSAEICLVSVGANNRYGHPVAETLETLQQAGGTIWRTDEQGDVVCSFTFDSIAVRTQRG